MHFYLEFLDNVSRLSELECLFIIPCNLKICSVIKMLKSVMLANYQIYGIIKAVKIRFKILQLLRRHDIYKKINLFHTQTKAKITLYYSFEYKNCIVCSKCHRQLLL